MQASRTRHNRPARRGMVAVMTAVLLPIIIGTMALAFDGGLMYLQRRKAQSVADAAALAAAYQMSQGNDFSTAQNAAVAVAQQNGVAIAPSQVTQSQGGTNQISVSINSAQSRFFSGLWGTGQLSISASAGANFSPGSASGATAPASTAAVLVLAKTGSSVTLSGTTKVIAQDGPIIVDSTSSSSILSSGAPSVTAPELDLSGNILYSGSNPNKSTTTNYAQPYTPDPLADLQPPDPSTMAVQKTAAINLSGSTSMTLNPGVYKGAINMSGSSSITLNPGAYYLEGGINMSGLTSISGNGVFLYNTGSGAVNLSGSGGINLSPMASGDYQGITIFQDRNSRAGATMSGGTNINNTGTFYFPSAAITLSGSSGVATMGSQFIANTLTFSGTSGINVNYDPTRVAQVPGASNPGSFALVR